MMTGLGVVSLLLVMLLFIWLWKKMKKKALKGGVLGFFLGLIPMMFFYVVPYNFYVLEGGKNCSNYKVIGSPEYEMKSGTKIQLIDTMACTIANDSDDSYVLEKIIFGGFSFPELERIPVGKYIENQSYIAYYFDDEIPESITTESTASRIGRNRIVLESDFREEYPDFGEIEEDPESPAEKIKRLREKLKAKRETAKTENN